MKRITRDRRLTPEEAETYNKVRAQVAEELPELFERHQQRMAALDQVDELLKQLKAAREEKGLTLADLTERTGMDRSALSKLETGATFQSDGGYARAVRRGRRQTPRRFSRGRRVGRLLASVSAPAAARCVMPKLVVEIPDYDLGDDVAYAHRR